MRAYADNVIIVLEPLPTQTASGIQLVHTGQSRARASRSARVISSGPGHYRLRRSNGSSTLCPHTEETPTFIPNQVKPGDRVWVDAQAGQDYSLDVSIPRHNIAVEFKELIGERGEFRIVREQEILCVEGTS